MSHSKVLGVNVFKIKILEVRNFLQWLNYLFCPWLILATHMVPLGILTIEPSVSPECQINSELRQNTGGRNIGTVMKGDWYSSVWGVKNIANIYRNCCKPYYPNKINFNMFKNTIAYQ